jgi:hypothetical protein
MASLGNVQLHPERSREVEGGLDVQLWGSRVTLTATGSHKLRIDAIEALAVAPSVYGGFLKSYMNIGRVLNTSTELSINALILDTRTLSWSLTASLTKENNKLLTLNDTQPYIDLGNGTRLTPGYPMDSRWSRPILGYTLPGPNGRLNTASVTVADSAIYMGSEAPNFVSPFSTTLTFFGRLSLNATFQYEDGLTQDAVGNRALIANLSLNPQASLGQQAAALAASCFNPAISSSVQTGICTDYGLIQTVNTFRFTSLSINYIVPKTWSERFRIPSMTIALQGSNLGLWTNYHGKDPDVNAITVGDATVDTGQLPTPRSWRLQIMLGN